MDCPKRKKALEKRITARTAVCKYAHTAILDKNIRSSGMKLCLAYYCFRFSC